MKIEERPRAKPEFLFSPRCGAQTRQGTPCQAPAMPNGRCRMHGGKSTGPPRGTQNALKHGYFTREAIERRRRTSQLLSECRNFLQAEVCDG